MTRRRPEFDPTAPLPPLLTIHEVAVIYRLSEKTIRRRLRKGLFRPLPWDRDPYRWSKTDIERDLASRRTEDRLREHGYTPRPARARAVKANLATAHDAGR